MGKHSPNLMANCFLSSQKHNPNGEVIVFGERRITWGQLTPRMLRIANALIKLGVRKDEKVAFMFHNTPEFIEVNGGIQVAGAVPAPMNFRFIPKEVEYQGAHCDARVFIYDSIWSEAVEPAAPRLSNIEHFVCLGESGLRGAIAYEEFVNSGQASDPRVPTGPEDVAVMIYTGGTTGFPKGVMLTYGAHQLLFATLLSHALIRALTMDMPKDRHKKVVEALPIPATAITGPILRTRLVKNWLKTPAAFERLKKRLSGVFTDPDQAKMTYKRPRKYMYPSMPFFHDAAYANLMMGTLMGNMIYVLPETVKFDPDLILATVEREQVEAMYNVPTGWKKLVSHPDRKKYDTSCIRLAFTGGGSCPQALKKQIIELFPSALVFDVFGQTEMTPATSFRVDFDPETIQERSVGKPIVDFKVVGENGKEMQRGEVGEIYYRSATMMKGYYKDEEKSRETMADGWLKSGDLGYVDENGEIRTVDRKQECINSGGEKIFPLEVEQIIEQHPKVDSACVIGVPDEEWGATVRAVVVLKQGEQMEARELQDFCRGEMAGYKIPRSVIFVEELPYSPVGKMLRQKVRDLYGKP